MLTRDKSVLVIIHVNRWQQCGSLEKIKENVETNSTNCSALLKLHFCHQYWLQEQVPLSGQNGAINISFIKSAFMFSGKMSCHPVLGEDPWTSISVESSVTNISLHGVQCGWLGSGVPLVRVWSDDDAMTVAVMTLTCDTGNLQHRSDFYSRR